MPGQALPPSRNDEKAAVSTRRNRSGAVPPDEESTSLMITRLTALLLLALGPAPWQPAAAEAAHSVRTEYSVTIRGIPVGRAELSAEFADGRYALAFSGGVKGLARLFSDAHATAHASGRIAADRLRPDQYTHVWIEDDETESVDMRFKGPGVTDILLDPPRNKPERYVPITAEQKADALDPVSAFLWPAADGGPAVCARRLRLIDGKRRFDITLSFDREVSFATRDRTYSGTAVVCRFRYEQIAGHRPGKENSLFLADSDDMEVWMAPAGNGLVAPVRIQMRTRVGRVVLVATGFRVE